MGFNCVSVLRSVTFHSVPIKFNAILGNIELNVAIKCQFDFVTVNWKVEANKRHLSKCHSELSRIDWRVGLVVSYPDC